MKKNYSARPIVSPSEFIHSVDIIVPFHGQYEKVTRLVESIYRCTRSNYFTLTLVDDFSPNDSFLSNMHRNTVKTAQSRKVENNFRAIRGTSHRGFAGATKIAFDRTENPYVCVINSDCVIEDTNWLRSLGESLLSLKSEGVRMVSPITNNPVGGHESQKGERSEKSADSVILEGEDYLTMYCFLCHRELFARCGGFLKEYPYGYYEDVEFARRMQKHGFKQAVCRDSWVRHEGQSTIHSLWKRDPQIRKIMEEENHQRCVQDIKTL